MIWSVPATVANFTTIALNAGSSGIVLNNGATLGEAGATVDLTSAAGIDEAAGASIIASTLATSDGSVGVTDLLGTGNARLVAGTG